MVDGNEQAIYTVFQKSNLDEESVSNIKIYVIKEEE